MKLRPVAHFLHLCGYGTNTAGVVTTMVYGTRSTTSGLYEYTSGTRYLYVPIRKRLQPNRHGTSGDQYKEVYI
ncbi:hypothetical protein MKX08_007087 [Trichoderma sp. CBMAI-0020]|nr:hypothetical protein MKX08_007087 [Trichoderma sp. CBMAI-0020]